MHNKRHEAFQDGGQFYDEMTGDLIVDYGRITDYDMQVAFDAREKFRREFPHYGFASDGIRDHNEKEHT